MSATDRHDRSPPAGGLCACSSPCIFVVWTALPALLYPNLPLDLIEALTYGREWQLGYDKLPPLPWWLVEVVYRLIGLDAAYYALAQVAVIARLRAGVDDRAAARRRARRAGRDPDRRRPALLSLHRRQVQSRRHPTAVLGARRLRLPCRAQARPHASIGRCSAWRSGSRCGRSISWSCWRRRSRCSCCSTAMPARRWRRPAPGSRSRSRSS